MNLNKFPKISVFQTDNDNIRRVRIADTIYNVTPAIMLDDVVYSNVIEDKIYKTVICEIYKVLRGKEFSTFDFRSLNCIPFGTIGFNDSFDKMGRIYLNYLYKQGMIVDTKSQLPNHLNYVYDNYTYKFIKPPYPNWAEILDGMKLEDFNKDELNIRRHLELKTNRDK